MIKRISLFLILPILICNCAGPEKMPALTAHHPACAQAPSAAIPQMGLMLELGRRPPVTLPVKGELPPMEISEPDSHAMHGMPSPKKEELQVKHEVDVGPVGELPYYSIPANGPADSQLSEKMEKTGKP